MAYEDIVLGQAANSKIIEIKLRDSTTGLGKTGLVHDSAGAKCYYIREVSLATPTAISLGHGTASSAYNSGDFAELDAANMPGVYQLHIPNAALAAGANACTIHIGFTGVIDKSIRILISANDIRAAALSSNLAQILGHAITQTGTQVADGFQTFFDTATPVAVSGLATPTNITAAAGVALAADQAVNVTKWEGHAVHAHSTGGEGLPVVQLHGTGGLGVDAPTNFEDLSIVDTTGIVKADLVTILGSALAGTAAWIAGAFNKFFNIQTPTGTVNSLPDVVPGVANGLFIAGTNAATTINTALTTGAITLTTPVQANIAGIKTTALPAESQAGRDAAALGLFLDVVTPALTCAGVNQTGDAYHNVGEHGAGLTALPAVVLANSASHGGAAAVITLATPIVANATQIEGSDATDQIDARIAAGLNTAIPGSPTADSINERIKTMDGGVSLADDAITAAKFDESTAFPMKSADSGATTVARAGGTGATVLTDVTGQLASMQSDVSTIDGVVDSIKLDIEADSLIDTTTTPWSKKVHKKGDAATVYFKKSLKTAAGVNVGSQNDIIGQEVHLA
jgi:hypothetical protein